MDRFIKFLRFILVFVFIFLWISFSSIRGIKKEAKNRNLIEKLAINASELPSVLKEWYVVSFKRPEQAIEITNIKDFSKIGEFTNNSNVNDSIYLLYYKYLGEDIGKVYLQNIKNGNILNTWDIPLKLVMDDLQEINRNLVRKYNVDSISINLTKRVKRSLGAIEISQPILSNDNALIFNCGSLGYLYKINKDSKLLWKSKRLVHHSIEIDSLDNIWTCSIDLNNKVANYYKYREDAILCLTPEGEEKLFLPLSNIFMNNKLFKKLIGSSPSYFNDKYGLDPYHLNSIVPVDSNGEFWRKGDVFLSFRTQSMVLLYRPVLDSIVWYQQGPWLAQHDVNIENDSVISMFNNNVWFFNQISPEPLAGSNIAYFNFKTQETIMKHDSIFMSTYEGRQTKIKGAELVVEATNRGKYFIFDSKGNIIEKFYIPYFSDDTKAMNPSWARVYKYKAGNFILQ